jgi:amidophosphoribosyltransferase
VKEACGVFGVYAPGRGVAHLTFDGLYALQHRGQESAGMAVSDGQTITVVKDMGLVTTVFDERTLSGLPGHLAVGHTRYSTHGSSDWMAAQPVYRPVGSAGFALGHNGNLTNTESLAVRAGMLPGMVGTDSDVVAELLAQAFTHDGDGAGAGDGAAAHAAHAAHDETGDDGAEPDGLRRALVSVLPGVEGAFSLVLMDATRLYGVRDPQGFRPLCLGRLGPADAPEGWVLASESPALDVIGADFVRELDPGELVVIDGNGVSSEQIFPPDRVKPSLCIFEFVYFARPDARLYDREVHGTRRRMGELLAEQAPVEADLVMGVPDSGVPAAEGYARRSGIPYGQGLVKNRYIARTFIDPDQQTRMNTVRRKLNPLRENIAGKRLIVVDDSIVRSTTARAVVAMLREAGATEVHLRISSPPFKWPCFYGIDTPRRAELLAANCSIEEIERLLGVDSLAYISIENLKQAIGLEEGFCDACLTGRYPVPVPAPAAVELRSVPGVVGIGVPPGQVGDEGVDGTSGEDGGGAVTTTGAPHAAALQAALPGV